SISHNSLPFKRTYSNSLAFGFLSVKLHYGAALSYFTTMITYYIVISVASNDISYSRDMGTRDLFSL
ncbi:MAG: hypothetical protein WBP74_10805, partial [Nitrososphaeraceae archaeon]